MISELIFLPFKLCFYQRIIYSSKMNKLNLILATKERDMLDVTLYL